MEAIVRVQGSMLPVPAHLDTKVSIETDYFLELDP